MIGEPDSAATGDVALAASWTGTLPGGVRLLPGMAHPLPDRAAVRGLTYSGNSITAKITRTMLKQSTWALLAIFAATIVPLDIVIESEALDGSASCSGAGPAVLVNAHPDHPGDPCPDNCLCPCCPHSRTFVPLVVSFLICPADSHQYDPSSACAVLLLTARQIFHPPQLPA